MRLIDADTLNFTCTADEDYKCQKIVDCNCCPFHTITLFEIENEPTVQAVPIRTGHWIINTYPAHKCVYCSNCKEEYYEDDLYMGGNDFPNYCPNCGAKVD